MRFIFNLLLLVSVCAVVCACGRMNAPVPPEGSVYQRTYY